MKQAYLDVKICGLTRTEDALAAAEFGASAVGFIFAVGKRQVTPEFVAGLDDQLPSSVQRVGVMVDPSLEDALRIADTAKLTDIQLHGNESASLLISLKRERATLGIIKVLSVDENLTASKIQTYQDIADLLLFDSPKGQISQKLDTVLLKRALEGLAKPARFWVAGGLTAENVFDVVRSVKPAGVDVASGVEKMAGIKSRRAIEQFIKFARGESS